MPEAGRAIIQAQLAIGGSALPWADQNLFAELMLCWDMRSYNEALLSPTPVLFDRGIPDAMGYLLLNNLPVPAHIEKSVHTFPYNQRVFIAPPWPEIFTQDNERKQTLAEAIATYHTIAALYTKLGYELLHLPLAPVEERVLFVMQHIV